MIVTNIPIEEQLLGKLRVALAYEVIPIDHACTIQSDKIIELFRKTLQDYKEYLIAPAQHKTLNSPTSASSESGE